jgi:nickel transport protein
MCQNRHRSPCGTRTRRFSIYLLLPALWVVLCVRPAWAHKVMIFSWVEGDTVYTESKFSGGKKAKNCTVVVYDKEGKQLLEGKTDEQGKFHFKVPKKTDLRIVLKASMGHMGEWMIPAKEITAVGPVSEERSAPDAGLQVAAKGGSPSIETMTSGELSGPASVGLSRQEVKALIDESLDRKLAPILNMLVDSLDSGPRVSEVIGGIGYIFGLVGVALYFANRRRKG